MANNLQGNLAYIDTTANSIITDTIVVFSAAITPTSANGSIIFLDASAGGALLRLQGATVTNTLFFDFSERPLVLTKGLHVTVTNCVGTIVYAKVGTGTGG